MRVFKYQIEVGDYVELTLPKGAQILSVKNQLDTPCLWALVDPLAPLEKRYFRFAGTGHLITETPENLRFIDTFFVAGGRFVFHFFEIIGSHSLGAAGSERPE